jgi:glycosyltransferase involved in cell wall biosynthesis
MVNYKISVIVPVFNVEKYLAICLNSILSQEFDSFEVICVNDESTDSSSVILQEYAKSFNNIRIINQKNSGLSVARNIGLKESSGEYILFVDSDDSIISGTLSMLYETSKNSDLDILDFNAYSLKNGTQYRYFKNFIEFDRPVDGRSYLNAHIKKYHIQPFISAWAHLYKRSFLIDNSITFIPNIYYEDLPYTARAHICAKRIAYLDKMFYHYRTNMNSQSKKSIGEKQIADLSFVAAEISRISRESGIRIPMDNLFSALKNTIIFSISGGTWHLNKDFYNRRIFKEIEFNLYNKLNILIYKMSKLSFNIFIAFSMLVLLKRNIKIETGK